MAKIYWKYVKNGTKTFQEVPETLKKSVEELALEELKTEEITQELFDSLIIWE